VCRQAIGDDEGAMADYRQALDLGPSCRTARLPLITILACSADETLRDGTEAERQARLLLEKERLPEYLDLLAIALAAQGHFDDAASTAEEAMALARKQGSRTGEEVYEAHLKAFRSGRQIPDCP